jgi:hypothetical protein
MASIAVYAGVFCGMTANDSAGGSSGAAFFGSADIVLPLPEPIRLRV